MRGKAEVLIQFHEFLIILLVDQITSQIASNHFR